MTVIFRLSVFASLLSFAVAYQPSGSAGGRKSEFFQQQQQQHNKARQPTASTKRLDAAQPPNAATAAATAALTVLLFSSPLPAWASPTAAQISLNAIPPTSVSVEIGDLPVVGNLLSGTYTKLPDDVKSISKPSIVIKSPADKVKAIQELATGGHVEFDIAGKIKTHLDIDVAADEAGVAKVRVASDLIPPLPYKNLASSKGSSTGGKESPWNVVTNLGNGESYYFNMKTGVTQFARPDGF